MKQINHAIRFYHARILTMKDICCIIEGEVWIFENRIAYVGENPVRDGKNPEKIHWDREIDAEGNLLMPGFKNAHTHSGMTFLRSYADDLPLQEWLNNRVFPMEANLPLENIYEFTKLAILEYLTSGITANFDMYLTPEPIAKAAVDMGFRTVLCGALNNFTQSVEEMEIYYEKYNNYNPLIQYQLGFHAEYTTDQILLEGVAALSKKFKTPVYTHNSETKTEVEACRERHQTTPTAFLNQLGMFEYGGGGFHCVYLSEEDIDIFKQRKLFAITNPASNIKLSSGIAPLLRLQQENIPLAIGTDGPASNNCLDMFREMFLTTGLQKLATQNPSAMDANDVLYMATVGGAHAMGLYNCDTLEEGKLADLIMIDLKQPNMQPIHNITKNIVYSASKQNVAITMVNGNILYEYGKFYVGFEVEQLYETINKQVEQIKNIDKK